MKNEMPKKSNTEIKKMEQAILEAEKLAVKNEEAHSEIVEEGKELSERKAIISEKKVRLVRKGKKLGLSEEETEKLIKEGTPLTVDSNISTPSENTEEKESEKNTFKTGDTVEFSGENFDTITKVDALTEEEPIEERKKIVVKNVLDTKKDIEKTFDAEEKKKEDEEINTKLKMVGVNPENLAADWQNFTKAEKLLIEYLEKLGL